MVIDSSLKAVLFDLDGLIVDTEPYQFGAFQTLLERRGILLPESAMETMLGYDEVTNLKRLKPQYELADSVEELLQERRQIYLDSIACSAVEPMAGFWEISAKAAQLGLQQAVVSSSTYPYIAAVLEKIFACRPELGRFGSYFDVIVCGDDVTRTKPAPDIYQMAVEQLDLQPGHCLAFEDSPAGVRSAVDAGVKCLAVVTRYTKPSDFPHALAVLESLHEGVPYLCNGV